MKHELSQRTINRLTQYHTILREYTKKEVINITSAQISNFFVLIYKSIEKKAKTWYNNIYRRKNGLALILESIRFFNMF